MKILSILLAASALAVSAPAQQATYDDGSPAFSNGATPFGNTAPGVGCGSGTTTTFFASGNQFAGNMFDIAPSVDMTIECVDVNWNVAGESINVDVWWCPGTVVGNDVNQLGTWTMFASGTATAAGLDLPTNVNLTPVGANPVFNAGSTYGIYVQVTNYAVLAGSLRYTNGGPTTYPGTHCSLTTYYGKGDGLGSSTFSPREWNGTLYTETAGPGGPSLSVTGTCPGTMTLSITGATANDSVAVLYGPAGSTTKPSGTCAGTTVDIANPSIGAILGTDGSGAASLTFTAPSGACGLTVQAVDIASCTPTNAVVL